MPPISRPITIDQFAAVGETAERLGFDCNFQSRTANVRHEWLADPRFDTTIREMLPDFLEYVIPVEFIIDGPVGFPISELSSVPDAIAKTYELMETARINFAQAVATNGNGAGRHDYAYLHGNLRGTSRLRDGSLRAGFLAVCREGVAVIGLQTEWEPQSETNQYGYRLTNHLGLALEELMPDGTICFPFVRTYVRFDEIEDVRTSEMCRVDGLVALLYVLNPRPYAVNWMKTQFSENGEFIREFADVFMEVSGEYEPERNEKRFLERDRAPSERLKSFQLWDEVNSLPSPLENFLTIAQRFNSNVDFLRAFARQLYDNAVLHYIFNGLPNSGGPGFAEDGGYRAALFSSSLVLTIQSKQTGLTWAVQSSFNEIDAAIDLLKHMCESSRNNYSSATFVGDSSQAQSTFDQNTQLDLVDQIERLVALHERGLLTDEEFLSAKRRLIN
jgi:hypothetical protein